MPSTACIVINWPCMSILCISTLPAKGELACTRRASRAERNCMKAPAVFCWATVARIHGWDTLICALALAKAHDRTHDKAQASPKRRDMMLDCLKVDRIMRRLY